jgi:hypothetical protein
MTVDKHAHIGKQPQQTKVITNPMKYNKNIRSDIDICLTAKRIYE